MRNRILDHLAHMSLESDNISFVENYSFQKNDMTDHLIRQKQLMQMIEDEMAALPKEMREVFQMSSLQHLRHREIDSRLDIYGDREPYACQCFFLNLLFILAMQTHLIPSDDVDL